MKSKVVRLMTDIYAMVESINGISGDRYGALRKAFDRIAAPVSILVEEATESPESIWSWTSPC